MTEYHVGCGLFGIYAGILNKSGDEWIDKSDVTNEVISAVALYLLDNNKVCFNYEGKKYRLTVIEQEEDDCGAKQSESET